MKVVDLATVPQLAAGSTSPIVIDSLREELSKLERTAADVSDAAERRELLLLEAESHRSLAGAAAEPAERGEHTGAALMRYLAAAEAGNADAAEQPARASLRLALLCNDLLGVTSGLLVPARMTQFRAAHNK